MDDALSIVNHPATRLPEPGLLHRLVQQWLQGFMIPGDIVTVDSFPRLSSGKVDRKQLVADYKTRMTGGRRR